MKVQYTKVSNKDEAYEAVRSKVNDEMMKKFKVKADITYNDSVKNINAKGKGFELNLNFLEDRVESDLSLSLLLRALKSKINSELEKELTKVVWAN